MLKSVGDDGRFPAASDPLDEEHDIPSIRLVDVEREPSTHGIHPLTLLSSNCWYSRMVSNSGVGMSRQSTVSYFASYS